MDDTDRYKLLFGPYRAPRCRVGRFLNCAIRGRVKVYAISDGRIPWPLTRRADGGGRAMLIVCGDLARAVRQESNQAVAYWWSVSSFC